MPEEEFIGVMKICDEFDILLLREDFINEVSGRLKQHPLITEEDLGHLNNKGVDPEKIHRVRSRLRQAGSVRSHTAARAVAATE